jgi:hypothetical protein
MKRGSSRRRVALRMTTFGGSGGAMNQARSPVTTCPPVGGHVVPGYRRKPRRSDILRESGTRDGVDEGADTHEKQRRDIQEKAKCNWKWEIQE